MTHSYPYFEPEFIPLSEFIPPLEACMDNDTSDDFTIIKVDGANKQGILLKIVQILSDLDLIILKSYVSSDGHWFMNTFHVTDHHGHKLNDPDLICFIKQFLNNAQRQNRFFSPAQVKIRHDNIIHVNHLASTVLELYFLDRPDIFSDVVAVLFNLSYAIDSGELWTHNGRVACIIYLKEQDTSMPITDRNRYDCLGENLASMMKVHHLPNELWEVRLRNPTSDQIHTERRLHQMLQEYKDYEIGPPPLPVERDQLSLSKLMDVERGFGNVNKSNEKLRRPQVSIEN
ncbi:ACT domain-containing protein ACR2-like [Phalaenopsis equestris]|uniref:ACT domain-containing protein ACR2-like n=1 Tax=Phalaenopsis equestris TaxID=78828 RepID=UPI0009E21293|nr:ACT domain-containing protein ACR2-like [Phalaenopsis equestris]